MKRILALILVLSCLLTGCSRLYKLSENKTDSKKIDSEAADITGSGSYSGGGADDLEVEIVDTPPELMEFPSKSIGNASFTVETEKRAKLEYPADGKAQSISITDASGIEWTLEIPKNALIDEEEISITPLNNIELDKYPGSTLHGILLEPDGLEFIKSSSITLKKAGETVKGVIFSSEHDGTEYDSATGRISFSTSHFSQYAVGYNKVDFKDVDKGAWYSKAVSFIAAREITSGTGGGNFSPEAMLTRGQFIVMLMRAYGIAPDIDPEDNFADAGDTYYTGYLAAAKRLGISAGIGNNLYAPEREITRQEMFTLLYNALKVIGKLPFGGVGKPLSAFTDADSISSFAKEAITFFVGTGIIVGNGGKLSPTSTTTRAEMAQVLYQLMSR